jgi:ribosomal protein S18 acetylase RimI-like enzyme
MTVGITIVPAESAHELEWRELWQQYCGSADVSTDITDATWARILDTGSGVGCVVALANQRVAGFATYVQHPSTWELKPCCYVEDLYIDKLQRGRALNIGGQLAEHMIARLDAGEWSRLYGITRTENLLAQKLYGRFSAGEPYLRYVRKPRPV